MFGPIEKFKRIAILLAVSALIGADLQAQDRLILEPGSGDDLVRVTDAYNLTVVRTINAPRGNLYVVTSPPHASADLTQQLGNEPGVLAVEVDAEVTLPGLPLGASASNPPASLQNYLTSRTPINYYGAMVRSGYVYQPAADLIRLQGAHSQFPAGSGIVAVIDTGVDPTHPALAAQLISGYDFLLDVAGLASDTGSLTQSTVAILDQSKATVLDSKNFLLVINQSTVAILDQSTVAILDGGKLPGAFGHGTMVSGLVHLVAPHAQIMPLRAFSTDGTARLSDVVRAIYFAADHGASVINMSFSFDQASPALAQAISYAVGKGVICVASTGNSGLETMVYPAGFPQVIGVASTSNSDVRSTFSNYGSVAKVGAPGEGLITLYPGNNYAEVWGTSFSAPLVAGTAALMLQVAPQESWTGAVTALAQGAHVASGIGDARLDVLSSLLYCAQGSGDSETESSDTESAGDH